MNVRELIEILNALDPESRIIKSKDDEGNGYQQVSGADVVLLEESEAGNWFIESVYNEHDADEMESPCVCALIY